MKYPTQTPRTYLLDSLAILRRSIDLARSGEPYFYRVAALQLRLLLCDTTRIHNEPVDIALAPRLLPDLRLPSPQDASGPDLALPDWLEIPLPLEPPLTIRRLIRHTCDQDGGAHVDPHPHAGAPSGPELSAWILTLGKLVYTRLNSEISGQF